MKISIKLERRSNVTNAKIRSSVARLRLVNELLSEDRVSFMEKFYGVDTSTEIALCIVLRNNILRTLVTNERVFPFKKK